MKSRHKIITGLFLGFINFALYMKKEYVADKFVEHFQEVAESEYKKSTTDE